MARKKRPTTPPSSYTYPNLHNLISAAVRGRIPTVHYISSTASELHNYSTHVMGVFTCLNTACRTDGWSSKKIAIVIHGYASNGYNAEVYGQRCRRCDELGKLKMDEQSYVDRVSYRVLKWAGVQVEAHEWSGVKKGPPHERKLCEGCKAGVCSEVNGLVECMGDLGLE